MIYNIDDTLETIHAEPKAAEPALPRPLLSAQLVFHGRRVGSIPGSTPFNGELVKWLPS